MLTLMSQEDDSKGCGYALAEIPRAQEESEIHTSRPQNTPKYKLVEQFGTETSAVRIRHVLLALAMDSRMLVVYALLVSITICSMLPVHLVRAFGYLCFPSGLHAGVVAS